MLFDLFHSLVDHVLKIFIDLFAKGDSDQFKIEVIPFSSILGLRMRMFFGDVQNSEILEVTAAFDDRNPMLKFEADDMFMASQNKVDSSNVLS